MKKKISSKFIKGPLKVDIIAALIKEGPPSALNTYLVLLYVAGLRKSNRIIPKYSHAATLEVKPLSFRRGLGVLQARGIITVQRGPGVKPVVELL